MKNLKEILEQNNHNVSFPIMEYTLEISPKRNIYTQIRNKYKSISDDGFAYFKKLFSDLKNINELLSSAYKALSMSMSEVVNEVVKDSISVGVSAIDASAVFEECERLNIFDDFNRAYRDFAVEDERIVSQLNNAVSYRKARKDSRPRWSSATIGGDMLQALGNQFQAAQMNAIEGIGNSIKNAIGDAFDEAAADEKRRSLFKNSNMREALLDGAYNAIINVRLVLTNSLNTAAGLKIGGFVSSTDSSNAQSTYNNLMSVSLTAEQKSEFAYKILSLDPYVYKYYLGLLQTFPHNYEEIINIAKFFGCTPSQSDLSNVVYKTLKSELGKNLDALVNNRNDVLKNSTALGLEINDSDQSMLLIFETASNYLDELVNNHLQNSPINITDESNVINLKNGIAKYIESINLPEKYYINSYNILYRAISNYLDELVSNRLQSDPINLTDANKVINLKELISKYTGAISLPEKYYVNSYNILYNAISSDLKKLAKNLTKENDKVQYEQKKEILANEDNANKIKKDILEYVKKVDLSEKFYSPAIKTIDKSLNLLDKKYRTVSNHLYNSREDADKAMSDIDSNKDILKSKEKFTFRHEYLDHIEKIKGLNIDSHVKNDYEKKFTSKLNEFDSNCKKAKHYLWRKAHNNNRLWNGDTKDMMKKYGFLVLSFFLAGICFVNSHWFIGIILTVSFVITIISITNISAEQKSWEEITQNGKFSLEEVTSEKKCVCPGCGAQNNAYSQYCINCGNQLR